MVSSIHARLSLRQRQAHVPASVFLTLTERCHLRCQQCYLVEDPRGELTLEEVKDLLDQLAEMGTTRVTFTGGEPMLRPDLFEILEYAHQHGFWISLFTSGTPCNPTRCAKLKAAGVDCVSVTLYGMRPEPHDRITEVPGSWEKTMRGLEHLQAAGLRTEIKFLQMTLNLGELLPTHQFAKSIGARFVMDFKITATHDRKRHPLNLQVQEEELVQLYHQMAEQEAMFARQLEPRKHTPKTGMCGAGTTRMVIGSDGKVYPCMDYIEVLGDARTHSLRDIWSNEAAQKVRQVRFYTHPKCQPCPDKAHCSYCPSTALVDTGDPSTPSETLCLLARVRKRVFHERQRQIGPQDKLLQPPALQAQDQPASAGCGGSCACSAIPEGLQQLLERLEQKTSTSALRTSAKPQQSPDAVSAILVKSP
ncbi:MAG: radical SAM protein [Myxococcota bacterium]